MCGYILGMTNAANHLADALGITVVETPRVISCYRGGEGGDWYSTDESHAALFGTVSAYTIETSRWIELTEDQTGALVEGGGYEADARLDALCEELRCTAILRGWEGDGLTIYTAHMGWAEETERDASDA